MNDQKKQSSFGRAIARAWEDEAFKQRLLKNPKEAIKELGIDFPEDRDLMVLEQAPNTAYLLLPPKPSGGELTDDVMDEISGGSCCQGSMYTIPLS